ncbi:hypothetical protein Tco_1173481 [Tanacetum coccineum]
MLSGSFYGSLHLNDEENPTKSSLDDMDLKHQPDNVIDKQPPVEQQPDDEFIVVEKDKTIVLKENVEVKVDEKPYIGTDFASLKGKKKKCQHALKTNYVLRLAQARNKKFDMALKPPFGQQSATTPAPKTKIQDYEYRCDCAACLCRCTILVNFKFK